MPHQSRHQHQALLLGIRVAKRRFNLLESSIEDFIGGTAVLPAQPHLR